MWGKLSLKLTKITSLYVIGEENMTARIEQYRGEANGKRGEQLAIRVPTK